MQIADSKKMDTVHKFLTQKEENEIIEAIRIAEDNTSGEIKVHLESTSHKDPFERSSEVFDQLQMNKTELKNGVLIYIAVLDRSLVILGDSGINKVVDPDFWNLTKDKILNGFSTGDFKHGLIDGILRTGEELKRYFPYQKGDTNEISDEISSN